MFEPLSAMRISGFLLFTVMGSIVATLSFKAILTLREKYVIEVLGGSSKASSTKKTGGSTSSTKTSGTSGNSVKSGKISNKQKKITEAKKNQIRIRLLILVPEFIGSLLKVVIGIDPYNYFNTSGLGFFNIRQMLSFAVMLGISSDITTCLFFNDVYKTFVASRKMQSHATFLDRHSWGFPAMIVFITILSMTTPVIFHFSLYKYTAFPIEIVDALTNFLVSITVCVVLFIQGFLMGTEAKIILENRKALSSTGEKDKVENVIQSLLKQQRLMFIACVGRLLIIWGLYGLGTFIAFRSPGNYMFYIIVLIWGGLQVSSISGVLACATDVTTSTSKDDESSTSSNNFSMKSSSSSISSSSVSERDH